MSRAVAGRDVRTVVGVVALTAALALLFFGVLGGRDDGDAALSGTPAPPLRVAGGAVRGHAARARDDTIAAAGESPREAPGYGPRCIEGVVRGADGNEPLAGAVVEVFSPRRRRWTPDDAAGATYFHRSAEGGVTFARAPWPALAAESDAVRAALASSSEVELGLLPVFVHDRPAPERAADDATRTDGAGRFSIGLPQRGAVVRFSHTSYVTRCLAITSAAAALDVKLHRALSVRGRVVDRRGRDVPNVDLSFLGADEEGEWFARADDVGRFRMEVGAAALIPKSHSPRWKLWSPVDVIEVEDGGSLTLVAGAVPSIRVVDDESGGPITTVCLVCSLPGGGPLLRAGIQQSPDGIFPLLHYLTQEDDLRRQSVRVAVGADGHVPVARELALDLTGEPAEVRLPRGTPAAITGRVHRSGAGVEGALISLRAGGATRVDGVWRAGELASIGFARSDLAGRFTLSAPIGSYTLQVSRLDLDACMRVDVPHDGGLDIDLDRLGTVAVEVGSDDGLPAPGLPVVLDCADKRRIESVTGRDGLATIRGVAPGPFSAAVARAIGSGVLMPGEPAKEGEVEPGEVARIALTVEARRALRSPRYVKLEVVGGEGPGGWTVRDDHRDLWLTVGEDGTIPIDVSDGAVLLLRDPHRRKFRAGVPDDPPPDFVVTLDASPRPDPGRRAYAGIVRDAASGLPVGGLTIKAFARGSRIPVTAVTAADGTFRLDELEQVEHVMFFTGQGGAFDGVMLELDHAPREAAEAFVLEIPRRRGAGFADRGDRTVSGRIVDETTGSAVAGAWISVSGVVPHARGRLLLTGRDGTTSSGADGGFEVSVPQAEQLRAEVVVDPKHASTPQVIRWSAGSTGEGGAVLRVRRKP